MATKLTEQEKALAAVITQLSLLLPGHQARMAVEAVLKYNAAADPNAVALVVMLREASMEEFRCEPPPVEPF